MTLRPDDDPTLMLSGDAAGEGGGGSAGVVSGPSLVDQRIVEAAIRRGLISAVQATSVLESLSGGNPLPSTTGSSPALQGLLSRGLVSAEAAAELEEEVKNDFVAGANDFDAVMVQEEAINFELDELFAAVPEPEGAGA